MSRRIGYRSRIASATCRQVGARRVERWVEAERRAARPRRATPARRPSPTRGVVRVWPVRLWCCVSNTSCAHRRRSGAKLRLMGPALTLALALAPDLPLAPAPALGLAWYRRRCSRRS
eukprot:scaffold101016_cov63-Phaeocystis_antarctica.AAC.1